MGWSSNSVNTSTFSAADNHSFVFVAGLGFDGVQFDPRSNRGGASASSGLLGNATIGEEGHRPGMPPTAGGSSRASEDRSPQDANTLFSSNDGGTPTDIGTTSAITPVVGEPTLESSRSRRKRHRWKHSSPPPAGQSWRGPVRGTGKWLAATLGIDYKTLQKRDAAGTVWVRRIDGKTLEVWTQSIEEDDKLLRALEKRNAAG